MVNMYFYTQGEKKLFKEKILLLMDEKLKRSHVTKLLLKD